MKKIMIALAAVTMAVGVQAAAVEWKINGMSDYQSKSVYSFNASDMTAVLEALSTGGANVASTIEGYSLGNATSGTGGRANVQGSSNGVDSGNSMFWIVFDSTIADGNKFAYTAAQDVSAFVYAEGGQSPGQFNPTFANIVSKTEQTIGNVPEPTSGLLLLLGVAGLALRRKQK